jgi:hypothetical protein
MSDVRYVVQEGRQIGVQTLEPKVPPPRRRKRFEPQFIQIPRHWITALGQSKSANTYRLALLILWEAFKREHIGGEIILSGRIVGWMPRCSKIRAAKELVKLGLIRIEQEGSQAMRVIRDIRSKTYKNKNKE